MNKIKNNFHKNKLAFSKKVTAYLLIALFFYFPLESVFAEENISENINKEETSASQLVDSEKNNQEKPLAEKNIIGDTKNNIQQKGERKNNEKEDNTDKKERNKKKKNDSDDEELIQAQAAGSSSGSSNNNQFAFNPAAKIMMPEADTTTGALVYSYPIEVPSGRNGMAPKVSLYYNSQKNDNASIVGFGWDLDIPKIERVNKHGVNKLYDYQDFQSSLSGELVNVSGNDYGAKIENGSFLKYQLNNEIWTTTDKKGTIYKFGSSNSSKIYNLSDTSKIYSWYLDEIIDTNGNFIKYTYIKDNTDNFLYPDKIIYTGNGELSGIFSVEFKKESRPDSYTINNAGFYQKIDERINSIETYIAGNLNRKYDLTYGMGDNGKRSMLEKITESGRDNLGITATLPSFDIAYTEGNIGLADAPSISYPWVTETDSNGNSYTTPFTLADQSIRIIDINGDGLKDIVKSSVAYGQWGAMYPNFWVLKNNGSGWVVDNSWSQPTYSYVNGSGRTISEYFTFSNAIDVGDWNGDGKDDLIKFWVENLGGGANKQHAVVLLNTGAGWTQNTNIETDTPTYMSYNAGIQNLYLYSGSSGSSRFIDLNGDGLIDCINAWNHQINGINYPSFAVLYNDGEDLKWDPTVLQLYFKNSPTSASSPLALTNSIKILDINGDGLVDFMSAHNYQINGIDNPSFWVLINNGHGWDQDFGITHPRYTALDVNDNLQTNYFSSTSGWQVVDINADNLPDFIIFAPLNSGGGTYKKRKTVLINTGKGWIQDDSLINIGDYSYTYNGSTQTNYPSSSDAGSAFLDINGDGLVDIAHPSFYQQQGIYYTINWTLIGSGKIANTLSKITLPEGGSYDIAYKMTSAYRDVLGNLLNSSLLLAYNTVEKIIQNDGNGITHIANYKYEGGHFFYGSAFNKRFAGFSIIYKNDFAGNTTKTYYHTANQSDSNYGEFQDEYWKIGKAYSIEQYDNANHLYTKTINKWDSFDLGGGSKFLKLAQTVNYNFDGDATHRDTAEGYTYDNSNGNVTQKVQWGEVSGQDNGTFTDTGSDKFTTDYAYASNASLSIVGLPSKETITDQNSLKVKESKFYYDLQALGSIIQGNLTKKEDWKVGTAYINNQTTYNSYGLATVSTDPRGKTTKYVYDAHNLYPATVTNAKNQSTNYLYNYALGKMTQKTDPSKRVFQYVYDGLGRLIEEKQPDIATPSTLITKAIYVYTDTPNAVSVKKSSYLDALNFAESYTYFDGLGRKIQERQEAEGTVFAVKDYIYNNLGLITKESLPYFSANLSKTSPTIDSALYINYKYDALGRVVSVTNAVGTTTNMYNDWKLTVIDVGGKSKDLYKNAYGSLVQVDEHNSLDTYSTLYNYNYLGNITKITDALSNIRKFTYDGLGRRLTAEDLHVSSDTSYGIWTYTYDNAGNLTQTLDPNGQKVIYTYDNLNRVLKEDYIGVTGTEATYAYDAGTDGIGKLTNVINSSITKNYTYNALGLLKKETDKFGLTIYITTYSYDRQGNQTTVTNPDNSKVQYIYNTAGLLDQVKRKESIDSAFVSVVNNFDYSPEGKVTIQENYNGTTNTNTYDVAKLYRLTSKVATTANGDRIQDLSYTYDLVGNITKIVDASTTATAKTSDYTYDDLYRLTSVTVTGVAVGQEPYIQTYSYDAIGNIITKSDVVGSYIYDGTIYANPHAVTIIGSATFSYDNNGNLLNSTSGFINTWDYKNRLIQSVKETITNSYGYDAEGQRVKLITADKNTYYPTKSYNITFLNSDTQNPTSITKHIFANSIDIATIEGTGATSQIYYASKDLLNSSSIITDSVGVIAETMDYFPFGGIRIDQKVTGSSFSEQRKFIGQEYDQDTGLNYLNARYYNATIGRFISQDPMFWQLPNELLADPQQLNSYSYARNNPIIGSDPSGLLTVIVPGTSYNSKDWSSSGSMSNFISSVGKTFNETHQTSVINDKSNWSGGDNSNARQKAAEHITGFIKDYKFADGEQLNIVGHSHGGNIGILVSQKTERKIDNLVTLGTPARSDYQPNYDMVGRHINAYSNVDMIQGGGGGQTNLSAVLLGTVGNAFGIPGAIIGYALGNILGWGEFGSAGRKFSGAENISVTKEAGRFSPFSSHSNLLQSSVWSRVDKLIK